MNTTSASKQKTANKTPFKDIGLFGGLLSNSKSKSQSLLSKSATYHKRCIQDEFNKISSLSNSRQKNRELRVGHYL